MKSHSLLSFVACVAVMVLACAYDASAAEKVSSERSTAPAQPAQRWRSDSFPTASVARLQYREMPVADIYKVQRYNDTRNLKAEQIGIGRVAASAGVARTLPALKWMALRDGSSVARIEVKSPVALAMRVGLDVGQLDPRAELRFGGSDRPREVVAMMTGAEMRRIADARGVAWTPATDGERQIIEVYLPPRVPRNGVKLQAPQASHLLVNSLNDFKILPKIGESAACNVDTACRVGELGANFVSAKNAVAHMVFNYFQANGTVYGTFICSGTLLADTLTATQIPYFYSANHCFYGGDKGAPLQDLQTVANTLTTYWGYEATACNSGVQAAKVPLAGGATVLYADADTGTTTTTGTDAMLLRLNGTPPAGSEYAGWSSALLASGSNIIGIHHPQGDAKKVSSGQQVTRDAYLTTVAWLSGTTEGGSSGSGLFTADGDGYHLRGGLYGGSASCANTGTVANTGNRDYYSRFDVIFPNIKQWLAPVSTTPIRVNGSHPLIHSPASPAAAAPTSSAIPAPAAVPLDSRLPRIRAIRTGPFEP
ncbi:MAG: hypothetical protein EOP92_24580 [Lysobacteraceae bacterium]|nr:MAG: hypothetical protein EOP92_24580 [Xanthomonadaceae bacterium]